MPQTYIESLPCHLYETNSMKLLRICLLFLIVLPNVHVVPKIIIADLLGLPLIALISDVFSAAKPFPS